MLAGCSPAPGSSENAAETPFVEAVGRERLLPAPDEALSVYADPEGRFSIAIPPGWNAAPDAPGIEFNDPASGALLRVSHVARFDQAVAAVRSKVSRIVADTDEPGEYRLLGQTPSGETLRARVISTRPGAAIAEMRYPGDASDPVLDAVAEVTLTSLNDLP